MTVKMLYIFVCDESKLGISIYLTWVWPPWLIRLLMTQIFGSSFKKYFKKNESFNLKSHICLLSLLPFSHSQASLNLSRFRERLTSRLSNKNDHLLFATHKHLERGECCSSEFIFPGVKVWLTCLLNIVERTKHWVLNFNPIRHYLLHFALKKKL